jgi:tRNA dimethylallyltransferase
MNRKLLVICGPTASGKTKLAIRLAKKFDGELISADSRQVYKEMEIGTGKDLIDCSKLKTKYRKIYGTKIWGYDLADPKDDFSVSKYYEITKEIISGVWKRKRLPIIVGGSGLYIKSLISGISTIGIDPDYSLREKLCLKKKEELFQMLFELDEKKAMTLNNSDRNNSRRIIRAIEIANANSKRKVQESNKENNLIYDSVLVIGLKASGEILHKNIEERVKKRIEQGFENEILNLLKKGINWEYRSMQGLGYKQYEDYFKKNISFNEFVGRWVVSEQKYAKRQLTWFKRDEKIKWFNISGKNFEKNVENTIQSWYYER